MNIPSKMGEKSNIGVVGGGEQTPPVNKYYSEPAFLSTMTSVHIGLQLQKFSASGQYVLSGNHKAKE